MIVVLALAVCAGVPAALAGLVASAPADRSSASAQLRAAPKEAIAFGVDAPEGGGLYAVNADGTGLKRLAEGFELFGTAQWSPDGSRIAFVRIGPRGLPHLHVLRADGRGPRWVLAGGGASFSWSPDGTRIASTFYEGRGIGLVRADGTGPTRITDEDDYYPTWSPDGKRIAFFRDDVLYVMNADGSGVARLAPGVQAFRGPEWSPSGTEIAFGAYPRGLYVVESEGGHFRRIVERYVESFAWSPNGRRLAFADASGDAYVVDFDGTRLRRIVRGRSCDDPNWSRDGTRIGLDCNAHLLLVDAAGREQRVLRVDVLGRSFGVRWDPLGRPTAQLGGVAVPPSVSIRPATLRVRRGSIKELAAAGSRAVVNVTDPRGGCGRILVWHTSRGSVSRLEGTQAYRCNNDETTEELFDVALARNRVAWLEHYQHSRTDQISLVVTPTTESSARANRVRRFLLAQDLGGDERPLGLHHVAGEGSLLVAVTWSAASSTLWRVADRRLLRIRSVRDALTSLSVAGGRVVTTRRRGDVVVFQPNGAIVREFRFAPGAVRAARLDGPRLVVSTRNAIEVYDLKSGRPQHARPVQRSASLEDVEGGRAVYVLGREIHLLSLADGRDRILATAESRPVRAQLDHERVFYSHGDAVTTVRFLDAGTPQLHAGRHLEEKGPSRGRRTSSRA